MQAWAQLLSSGCFELGTLASEPAALAIDLAWGNMTEREEKTLPSIVYRRTGVVDSENM